MDYNDPSKVKTTLKGYCSKYLDENESHENYEQSIGFVERSTYLLAASLNKFSYLAEWAVIKDTFATQVREGTLKSGWKPETLQLRLLTNLQNIIPPREVHVLDKALSMVDEFDVGPMMVAEALQMVYMTLEIDHLTLVMANAKDDVDLTFEKVCDILAAEYFRTKISEFDAKRIAD